MNRSATAMLEAPRAPAIGPLIRDWRQRRRLSQLDLALDAEISTRHLSFLENGRARPSREMVLHLTELMQVPLRERNAFLVAAGFAPMFGERQLDDPELTQARAALDLLLKAHEPYPALVVDRQWNLQSANRAAQRLLSVLPAEARQAPINVMRLSLDPQGMAPLILNLGEWRHHLLSRLRAQVQASGDPQLLALLQELSEYPPLPGEQAVNASSTPRADVLVLFRLGMPQGELALFSTVTVFGTPTDVTLSELALEAFYPADPASAELLRAMQD